VLDNYKNEILIAVSLLVLMGSVAFKLSSQTKLETRGVSAGELAGKIEDISIMQKLWKKNKSIPKSIQAIQSSIDAAKIKKFKVDKKKAHIVLENLTANELNRITGKSLASIPIQIAELSIIRDDKSYRLELRCKW